MECELPPRGAGGIATHTSTGPAAQRLAAQTLQPLPVTAQPKSTAGPAAGGVGAGEQKSFGGEKMNFYRNYIILKRPTPANENRLQSTR